MTTGAEGWNPLAAPSVSFVDDLLSRYERLKTIVETEADDLASSAGDLTIDPADVTPTLPGDEADASRPRGMSAMSSTSTTSTPATPASWVVKLHPDSGQVFYYDEGSKDTSWMNPYESSTLPLDETPNDMEISDNTDRREWLSGFDDAPSKSVFESAHTEAAMDRLSKWCRDDKLEFRAQEEALLNFPEYINVDRHFEEVVIRVNILLPKHSSITLPNVEINCSPTDTVGHLLNLVFAKYHIRAGKVLDDRGAKNYAFKLVGFHEYFLQASFPLGYYDSVATCMQEAVSNQTMAAISLHLVHLSVSEMLDLEPILSRTVGHLQAIETEKRRPNGDRWTESERSLVPPIPPDADSKSALELNFLQQKDISWPFRTLVRGVTNCPVDIECDFVRVEMNIYFNGYSIIDLAKLSDATESDAGVADMNICTPMVPFSVEPRFPSSWLNSKLEVSSIPTTARVAFLLVGLTKNANPGQPMQRTPLAGVAMTIIDFNRRLITGNVQLNLFPHPNLQMARDPGKSKHDSEPEALNLVSGVCCENSKADAGSLYLCFDSYPLPVIADVETYNEVLADVSNVIKKDEVAFTIDENLISKIENTDPLYELSASEKVLIWQFRKSCVSRAKLLPKILQAVPWTHPEVVFEMRSLLCHWAPIDPYSALELLDIRYSDPVVREFAIRVLDALPDHLLVEFLLQLVQALKYECYHDSPLARFLLRRALKAPLVIGHHLYWMLKSEMHSAGVCERFGVVLHTYVEFCGPHRQSLRKQLYVNDCIKLIADDIKGISEKQARVESTRAQLQQLLPNLPSSFCVCLTPRILCKSIKIQKCKVMDSKKLPLWIVFENADRDGKDFYTIFKSGDDLRQDQLTLQLLRAMDNIWRHAGSDRDEPNTDSRNILDLRLKPYKCCSTGHELGMIEVVVDSNTTANIQTEYGGKLTGAFSSTPIDAYLREHNPPEKISDAIDNFVRTCAGYCVATYVLGIGDRHADNIMVAQSGHLFHIDFGHFLGNFKSKFGINRERSPFVFTPEMAYVMRSTEERESTYAIFEKMCCDAYNMIRSHANLFINMFILMVPAGMPELLNRSDITYLREMLSLELSNDQANAKFIAEIKNSLNTVSRRIDNWIHNLKHKV